MPRKAVKLPRVSETVLASPAAPALHTPAASATLERGRFLSESDDRGDHHAQHLRSRQRGLPLGAGAALRRVRRKVRFGLKLLFLIPALLCAFWVSGDARQRPLRRDSRPKLNLIACNPSRPNRAGLSPGRTAPGAAQAPPRFVPSRTLAFRHLHRVACPVPAFATSAPAAVAPDGVSSPGSGARRTMDPV